MRGPLQEVIERLHARYSALVEGDVATYIPELGRADPAHFAICCTTVDGETYEAGDASVGFTIQSISKPFVYGLALEDAGVQAVTSRVGLEPSGEAFNAISLEPVTGRPRNPMINAGAIATASLVRGASTDEQLERVNATLSAFAGRPLEMDSSVYQSERATGHRNRAIAYLLRNADILGDDVDAVLDRYFMQCSMLVTARDLALMAATLAAGGRHPVTDEQVIAFDHVQRVLSVMSTCGMYDYAGSWLYRVGMPAKSGVSGGIVAVLPGQLGIGVYSPALDTSGNSVRGIAVCEALSDEFGLHLLRPPLQPACIVTRQHTLADAGSKRRRTKDQLEIIANGGREVHVFRLQGPLAFSTAEAALRRASTVYEPGATIIFDCQRVPRADAAALRLMQAFVNEAQGSGGTVIVTALRTPDLWLASSAPEGGAGPLFFADIDSALEWCEDRLVGASAIETADEELPLERHPLLEALTPTELQALASIAARRSYEDRDVVVHQGEAADAVYFVMAGTASVYLNLPGERRHRLATMGPGTVFGELALLDNQPRTADVEADGSLVCHVLDVADLALLDESAPGARAKLLEQLARDLATRLRRADLEIMTLAT